MKLNRTRLVLEEAKRVLVDHLVQQSPMASYLTEYILIIFYSEVEEKINETTYKFIGNAISSPAISDFLYKSKKSILQRIKKGELCDTLELFGKNKKTIFLSLITESEFQQYQNFMINRDKVAHSMGDVTISWLEVQKIADVGEKIIKCFIEALNHV